MQDHPVAPQPSSLNAPVWREAGALTAAALAAQVVTAMLTSFAAVPLLTAMLATFAFTGTWLGLTRRAGPDAPSLQSGLRSHLYTAALTAAGVFLGARLISLVLGSAHAFACEPAVPWRIEIAIFGSFMIGVLTRMAAARGRARLVYPLALIALLWIAPFYGFFLAPVFLAVGLATGCEGHGVIAIFLAAAGMIAGERLGNGLGAWLSNPRDGGHAHP